MLPLHWDTATGPRHWDVQLLRVWGVQNMNGEPHKGIGEPVPNSFPGAHSHMIRQACDASFVVGAYCATSSRELTGQATVGAVRFPSRCKAGFRQNPYSLFGAGCVPRCCRRGHSYSWSCCVRSGFGAGSKSVLRHWSSTLPPAEETWTPPADGAQRKFRKKAPSTRRHGHFLVIPRVEVQEYSSCTCLGASTWIAPCVQRTGVPSHFPHASFRQLRGARGDRAGNVTDVHIWAAALVMHLTYGKRVSKDKVSYSRGARWQSFETAPSTSWLSTHDVDRASYTKG